MNRENVQRLLDRLKNVVDDDHFYMANWLSTANDEHAGVYYDGTEESIPVCKTAGCLAGEVFLGLTPEERLNYFNTNKNKFEHNELISVIGRKELGLEQHEAQHLFQPDMGLALHRIKRHHAIAVLEIMLAENAIDWGKAEGDDHVVYSRRLELTP